uniref:Uncharacterized LOC113136570 n=1 Tax=Mastacembelus armatus TaxID=205130 RepID=A0A7N8WZW4_9TELE
CLQPRLTLSQYTAAAVWLLAVLGPGLSQPDEPGFSLCSHCFYRQTPPQGASAETFLRPLCHTLPGGQTFATLSKPSCDTTVYSAFHLSHGWTEREGKEGEEFTVDGHNLKAAVPALLRGGNDASHPVSPTDSPIQHWDSTVTTLVHSSIFPRCSTLGGDLYILTGAGKLGAAEDGDKECQMNPLWSAVCCAAPQGKGGFSVGLIGETGGRERQVSVKELEDLLGVAELFSEGCGGADAETEKHSASGKEMGGKDVDSETTSLGEEEETDEVTQETDEAVQSASSSEKQHDVKQSRPASPESSADYETVDEEETDTNSSSTLVNILSTTLSIVTFPLRPVVSTITQLPGQVIYVLQEDLGVLSALPGDTFSLFHLLTSDLLSYMGSAAEMLLCVGEICFSNFYYCSSSMLGALMGSCHLGVTGMGTLSSDTLGIFGDVLDNGWWVTKFFGGWLFEQSQVYVETVASEVGGQANAVGRGLGKLAGRSGRNVGNVFTMGGGLIMGVVDMVIGAVREVFGQESSHQKTLQFGL